ncbi:hypothetical protein BOTCAL_0597g00030 [Botryotinia calthae]|uniref:Uncharacterized protein n=1 Tax=Botryotinia calthae TaxID=38488 RepID=A0A4Y8CJ14_9HELO|nr:hypothetical protein BOTCAL_0597g00030 [Botryotinia calthae]
MSEAGHLKRRQQRNSEHTNKSPGSEASQILPKHGSIQRPAQSSQPSEQSLLRSREHEAEAEQAHEEHTKQKSDGWRGINLHTISGINHGRNSTNHLYKRDARVVEVLANALGHGDGGLDGVAIKSLGWL